MGTFDDGGKYSVVINHEEQYSIWPVGRDVPIGWKPTGFTGTKREALAHIEEVWTDMRPASLRKNVEELERKARG